MQAKRFIYFVVLISFTLLFIAQLLAQKTDIRVDGQNIKTLIAYMANDKYLGRKPLTPQFKELLEWAKNNFEKWGLEPAGENGTFFQSVPITGRRGTYAFSTGTPRMIINKREFFTKSNDFSIDYRSTTGKKLKREIVFVGYGICAPAKGLDEYKNIDVRNKLVFVFKGSPKDVKRPRSSFSPRSAEQESETEAWETESKDSTKIMIAYEKGAAGIIFYNPNSGQQSSFRFRRTPIEKPAFKRDFIIVADVSERVFQWVFWRNPQETERAFTRRMDNIRFDIKQKKNRSFATGIQAQIKGFNSTSLYGEKFGNNISKNVIEKISGTDPVLKNEYVILGGHFDHIGLRGGQVYNGADDNASGSAVVMEVARLMGTNNIKPKRTVVFCLWTGEEMGLIGSRYWVKNPTDGISMDQVVTYFNMDMVGLGEKIGAPGALNFPSTWEIIKKYQDQDIIDSVEASTGGPGGSDHSGFIELGIESLALMTRSGGGHPDYHDTGDDANKMESEILRKTGQFVLQGTINLANEPKSLIIKDRQNLYDGLRWKITAINPDLKVRGGWSELEAKTESELADLIIKTVQELKNPQPQQQQRRFFRRRMPRTNLNLGVNGAAVFDYDIEFMNVAHKTLNFGRVDFKGDDGVWLDKGLTDAGRKALAAMEDSSIVLCLVNPSVETFNDVLAAANKPFIVSGMSNFDSTQVATINEKKVVVAVDFDPEDVARCEAKLKQMKEMFGDADNLILNLVSTDELDSVKQDLYMRLFKDGWTKNEIYAIGGSGAQRGSMGNFSRFVRRRGR